MCLSQTSVADRERDLAKLGAQLEQLQLTRERQAVNAAELEKEVETLTRQRDAQHSAAAEAATRLSDDVRNLRVTLDETSRRERQVIIIIIIIIMIIQYLYSALKSCKGYGGAGGFRLRLSEQVCFEVFFKGV